MNDIEKTRKAGERLCHVHTLLCEIAQDFGPCREIEDAISATSDAARILGRMTKRMENAVNPSDDPE